VEGHDIIFPDACLDNLEVVASPLGLAIDRILLSESERDAHAYSFCFVLVKAK